jgi:hypothetical protein
MNTGTAPLYGGKVIKTLTNIRFIRSPLTHPTAAVESPSPKDLTCLRTDTHRQMRETQKQASEECPTRS